MIISIFGRKIYVRKEIAALSISVAVIVLGLAGNAISNNNNGIIIEVSGNTEKQENLKSITAAETPQAENKTPEDEIKVYVVGCVNSPGIVTLKKGQIIDEAIRLAGGVTENADLKSINLVYKLKDNVMIYVKSREEINSNKGAQNSEMGPGIEIISDSRGAVLNESASQGTKKININSASENELDSLPGIGKETAKDIIAYREKNGGFKKLEDIMKVSGIKESRFNSIKDFIIID